MNKNVTLEDIAKKVNKNKSTVSRALNDASSISQKTKDAVKSAANELGYKTGFEAKYHRKKSKKLIGLILPRLGRFFTPDMVSAIEKITKDKGYNLIVFQSDELLIKEKEYVLLCKHFGVQGLLVSVSEQTCDISHFDFFLANNIPFVLVDRVVEQKGVAAVKINDFNTAYSATNYLITNHRRIAGVFSTNGLDITKKRKLGFESALKAHSIPYYSNFCFSANSSEEAKNKFLSILYQDEIPEAVFVMSDDLLAGVTQAIHEHSKKLRIGRDIFIISISNGYLPYYIYPNITHIKHSGTEVGETAANYLLELIERPTSKKELRVIETELVPLYS